MQSLHGNYRAYEEQIIGFMSVKRILSNQFLIHYSSASNNQLGNFGKPWCQYSQIPGEWLNLQRAGEVLFFLFCLWDLLQCVALLILTGWTAITEIILCSYKCCSALFSISGRGPTNLLWNAEGPALSKYRVFESVPFKSPVLSI